MDYLIEEILTEMSDPIPEGQPFIDLDDQVPPPVRLPADEWVEILNDAKYEFNVSLTATETTTTCPVPHQKDYHPLPYWLLSLIMLTIKQNAMFALLCSS